MAAAADTNALLDLFVRLAGNKPIPLTNSFWLELLSYNHVLSSKDLQELEQTIALACSGLVENSRVTHNFARLVLCVLNQLGPAIGSSSSSDNAVGRINAVVILRCVVKHVTELLRPAELRALFTKPQDRDGAVEGGDDLLLILVERLFRTIIQSDTKSLNYVLVLECINLLFAAASTQLYTALASAPLAAHPALHAMHAQRHCTGAFVERLLRLWMEHAPPPSNVVLHSSTAAAAASSQPPTMLQFIRNAAASVLMLPFRAVSMFMWSWPSTSHDSPLADAACMLLLLLTHYNPYQAEQSPHALTEAASSRHVFREALSALQNGDQTAVLRSAGTSKQHSMAAIPYALLFDAFGRHCTDESSTLLLYSLLTYCGKFQDYILVRSDIDSVIVPVLKLLYQTQARATNQLYMLQIIILILTQDATVAHNIHKIIVPSVPWYREHSFSRVSLGSLLFAVLLHAAYQNLASKGDFYLQSNTFAALINLAPTVVGLHPVCAQKLVGLFAGLTRRADRLRARAAAMQQQLQPDGAVLSVLLSDIKMKDELARMVLEVIHAILLHGFARNVDLLYCVLHRQEVFTAQARNARFADIIVNIQALIAYFNDKIDATRGSESAQWSEENVSHIIAAHLRAFNQAVFRPVPQLTVKYEEEAASEEFFVPYVWSLIVARSSLNFNLQSIMLFTPVEADSAHNSTNSELLDIMDSPMSLSQANSAAHPLNAAELKL